DRLGSSVTLEESVDTAVPQQISASTLTDVGYNNIVTTSELPADLVQKSSTMGYIITNSVLIENATLSAVIFHFNEQLGIQASSSNNLPNTVNMKSQRDQLKTNDESEDKIFGKPTPWHRRSKHLAVQECNEGVTVFSLITKQNYFGKPILHDYDAAFSDLTTEFKKKNLKHLICSPIGCVRDKVNTDHFIRNVRKFQQVTKATVTIVSYYQKSFRTLRNGMSHPDFVKELEDLIYQNSKEEDSSSAIDLQQSPVSPRVTPGHQTYSAAVKSGSVKVLKQSSG
ncbi:hypothetical protein J6590_087116, partial [Homalodisca vitripennis]